MKTISGLIFALLSVSFCSGRTSLLSKNSWKTIRSYLRPKDDKKMSMTDQTLSKISAYENVKENVCPENQEKWGFLKHLETEKIFVENTFQILPWDEPVMNSDRFVEHHAEMKPFVLCMDRCFDLSAMFASAVRHKRFFLIESLVDASFEMNGVLKRLLEPRDLVRAIKNDNKDLTRTLIHLGSLNAKDNNGYTALHEAACNNAEVVRILIDLGADKEAKNHKGRTAFQEAAYESNVEILRVLIDLGAKKDAKDNSGYTALHDAARRNKVKIARILIDLGANKEAKDDSGGTALHEAVNGNNVEVARVLIEKGTDKEVKNKKGRTALHEAACGNKVEVARVLIDLGADKEAKDNSGRTTLHGATYWNKVKAARVLIEKGADKEAKGNGGGTALHEAAFGNSAEVARILIEKGADKDAKDNSGRTALDIAKHYCGYNRELAKILIETEAKTAAETRVKPFMNKNKFALKQSMLLISCFVIFISIFACLMNSN